MIHFADYSSYRLTWKAEQKINDLPKSISYLLTSRLRNTVKHGKASHHWVFFSWCQLLLDSLFIEILIGEHLLEMSIKTALSSLKIDWCCWPSNIAALLWVCFVMNGIESMYLLDEAVKGYAGAANFWVQLGVSDSNHELAILFQCRFNIHMDIHGYSRLYIFLKEKKNLML